MRLWVAIIATSFALFGVAASADQRVALVIGNDSYAHLPNLNNPGRDARDMALKLRHLGFEVVTAFNATERQMYRAIRRFGGKLNRSTTGLVYYAGHGIQFDGTNYLIPVDARLESNVDLISDAIDIESLLETMRQADTPLNIIILDACRNNPIKQANRNRSISRGLTIVENPPNGALGTSILYAAAPGQVAADGDPGKNGVFTGALLRHIDKPGWPLEKIFKATIRDVKKHTSGAQVPWQQGSLQGDFFFKPAEKVTPPAVVRRPEQPHIDKEALFWRSVRSSSTISDYEAYLEQFPKGAFAPLARARIARLRRLEKQATVQPPAKPVIPQVPKMATKRTEKPETPMASAALAPDRDLVAVGAAYFIKRDANVREAPSINSTKITSLAKGTEVFVPGRTRDGQWYHVKRRGIVEGFVYKTLLISKADKLAADRAAKDRRLAHQKQQWELAEARRRVEATRLAALAQRRRVLALKNSRAVPASAMTGIWRGRFELHEQGFARATHSCDITVRVKAGKYSNWLKQCSDGSNWRLNLAVNGKTGRVKGSLWSTEGAIYNLSGPHGKIIGQRAQRTGSRILRMWLLPQ